MATISSGSRGIYGAISTAGEWGLKNHCAVAYTDKGTGNGVHDLDSDTVNRIDGTRGAAAEVMGQANFRAEGTPNLSVADYKAKFPLRIAVKHAHSQQNPESRWGQNVLDAIEFALYVLDLGKDHTLVIASSVSNGGGAVLRALEQDEKGLIDGVVASEPNINPQRVQGFSIKQGARTFAADVHGRPLFDYITYSNVFQSCASAGTLIAVGQDPAKGPPAMGGVPAGLLGRCSALRRAGLLHGDVLADQITESQQLLNGYGVLESSNIIAHPYQLLYVYSSIAATYANAYGSFSVVDNLCGYSFAATLGQGPPVAKSKAVLAADFAAGSGIPPTGGTNLINNAANGGAGQEVRASHNESGEADEFLDGVLCLRRLATGTTGVTADTGMPLSGSEQQNHDRVQAGLKAILGTGNLRGKPALIIHGRDDALLGVNFTSRSYYGLNQKVEGQQSQLAYIEVTHANHLDTVNKAFNIDTQIPLDYYLHQALDRMYDHLRNGTKMPSSQVIPTSPIGMTGDMTLSKANLPDFDGSAACPIRFSGDVLDIPECTK